MTSANVEKGSSMDHIESVEEHASGLVIYSESGRSQEEAKVERRLLLKLDLMLLPLLSAIYFLSTMDRGDIANAATAGMIADLHLSAKQYSNIVSLFYVGYIVFQLPGDIFLRKITPPIQIGLAMIVWGSFTALLATSRGYASLIGFRIAIGATEAFVQAAPLYLTLWYKRKEFALRVGILFSMMAVAGSFNGIIAYGIQKNIKGALGIAAWKWIFIIEGSVTIAFGFLVMLCLPPVPEKVRWGFSPSEKDMLVRRTLEAYNTTGAKIIPRQLVQLFKNPKIYFYISLYACTNVSLAALTSFLPGIIKILGYKSIHAQLLTIPVYVCAAASLLLLGFLSDRFKHRGSFVCLSYLMSAVGWIILLSYNIKTQKHLAYGGTFLIAIGTYPQVILILSWMNSNIIGFTKRAASLAAINMVGQSFSIAGAELFDTPPAYIKGKSFALGTAVLGALIAGVLMMYLTWQNKKKRDDQSSEKAAGLRLLGLEEVCEEYPDFFYWL